jgi:hypothetical protein
MKMSKLRLIAWILSVFLLIQLIALVSRIGDSGFSKPSTIFSLIGCFLMLLVASLLFYKSANAGANKID